MECLVLDGREGEEVSGTWNDTRERENESAISPGAKLEFWRCNEGLIANELDKSSLPTLVAIFRLDFVWIMLLRKEKNAVGNNGITVKQRNCNLLILASETGHESIHLLRYRGRISTNVGFPLSPWPFPVQYFLPSILIHQNSLAIM